MKRIISVLVLVLLMMGCSSAPSRKELGINGGVSLGEVTVVLVKRSEVGNYYTQEVLAENLKKMIIDKAGNVLSNNNEEVAVNIIGHFKRHHINKSKAALSAAIMGYKIEYVKNGKVIHTIEKYNLEPDTGFTENLKITTFNKDEPKDELVDLDFLSEWVVEELKKIN